MITISKDHRFEYAHRLHLHKGKCFRIHGHEGKIVWYLRGPVNKDGMIIDFYEVKSKLDKWVDDNWDHKLILYKGDPLYKQFENMDIPGLIGVDYIPTSEHFAEALRIELNKIISDTGAELYRVDFWETSNAYASSITEDK